MTVKTPLGQDTPHDSAWGHVTGQSVYIDDQPYLHGELVVGIVGSPYAHARLNHVDASQAMVLPGVVAVLTAKDIPGHNRFGPIVVDEDLLVSDVARYKYHPVVLIAAETPEALETAKKCVALDMTELPAVLTLSDARAKGQFLGDKKQLVRGDVQHSLSQASHTLTGSFVSGGQDHFYLESHVAQAIPGEFGQITIHSSTQHPSEVQREVAGVLGLPHHHVVCITKRMGGAFGGKETQATHYACMAALVAHKTGRPARLALTKDDDMRLTGKRHPFEVDYTVGFDETGRITALKADLYCDGGCAVDLSPSILGRAMTHIDNAYFLPDVEINGWVCETNNASNTAFRGFGGPQGVAVIENIMEEIAFTLGKDPLDVRRVNLYGDNDRNTTPYGQVVENYLLPDLMVRLEDTADYRARMAAVKAFNTTSKTHLKGLSMSTVKFGISFNTVFLNQANALVNIYLDGSVQVSTGATEMGQGVNTKISQLVADALGVEVSSVMMMPTSTEKNHNTSATAASSGSDLNGSAAVDACSKIMERLRPFAAEYLVKDTEHKPAPDQVRFAGGWVWDERLPGARQSFKAVVEQAYLNRISLGERGWYATQGLSFDPVKMQGSPFLYFTTGCCVSEVLIDRFTGDIKLERTDILMDIGRSINPGIDRGQITGAFVQGLGWVTTEDLRYDATGEILTHSPTTYKIPNIQDIPEVFNVDWVDNDLNVKNIRGSKAVGEPPLLLAISVWTAVKHALGFVSGAEIPRLRLPATNEEVLSRLTYYQSASGQAS